MAIFTAVLWVVGALLIPETYAPVLQRKRALKLSEMTGKVYKSRADIDQGPTTFGKVFKTSLSRPWILLFSEPIVLLLSIYMAIIYGTLYMMFAAFPIVYQETRGWTQGIGGLAFLGVAVGMIFAVIYSVFDNKRYAKLSDKHGGFAPPETRLPPCLVGGICLPIGLFWFAWTNGPNIHWMSSIAASAPFGFGMVLVFLGIMNYLIDAYTIFAASVLAANSVLRSLFGAAFPLFTSQMYAKLGIHWASSIPAFLALACVPLPIFFMMYGAKIREKCKFAAQSAAFMKRLQGQMAQGQSQEKEEEEEQTAADYSYEAEEDQPHFEEIRAGKDNKREGLSRTSTYESNPFDIDRVNTRDSFTETREGRRSRASSMKRA